MVNAALTVSTKTSAALGSGLRRRLGAMKRP